MSRRQKWTEGKLNQLRKLLGEGLIYSKIGKKMGFTEHSIQRAVARYNLPSMGRGRWTTENRIAMAKCQTVVHAKDCKDGPPIAEFLPALPLETPKQAAKFIGVDYRLGVHRVAP